MSLNNEDNCKHFQKSPPKNQAFYVLQFYADKIKGRFMDPKRKVISCSKVVYSANTKF